MDKFKNLWRAGGATDLSTATMLERLLALGDSKCGSLVLIRRKSRGKTSSFGGGEKERQVSESQPFSRRKNVKFLKSGRKNKVIFLNCSPQCHDKRMIALVSRLKCPPIIT